MTADYEFDRGVAVTRLAEGEYAADLGAGWVIGGGVNGGYVLAVIGNAVREQLAPAGHPDPISVSSYYLSPSRPGPATIRMRILRQGRASSTVAASLVQQQDGNEIERVSVLATYGVLQEHEPEPLMTLTAPELPPVEDCIDARLAPEEIKRIAPLLERFGTRADPSCVGWALGEPSGRGLIQGWFKLVDDRPIDPIALLLVVDSLPPVTFDLGLPGWAPTLELTAHVRAQPVPGWAKVRHATRTVADGYFEEDCEVWDAADRLVAQSRQLALVPRP